MVSPCACSNSSNNPVDDPNQAGTQDYVTTTDANGLYNFVNLAPGTYRVQFDIPAIYSLTTPNAAGDTVDSDAVLVSGQPYGRTGDYTLAVSEYNDTVDAGFIARASLGDRIWLDSNGNGLQDVGETSVTLVGGLPVDLMDSTGTTVIASTFTDLAGNYVFTELVPGDYRVRFPVPPAGYLYTNKNTGAADLDSDVNPGTRLTDVISLDAGENDPTWDAGLVAVASIGDYVWYDNNLNGLQDDGANSGVPNVTVRLLNSSGTQATRDDGSLIPDVQTDANGYYSFTNLRPGTYSVQFTRPANTIFTAQNVVGSSATNGSDATESGVNIGRTVTTTLTPGQNDTRWDAGLIRLASIGDFVWRDLNDDGQQNTGEPGVAGAIVTLLNAGTGLPVATDALGNAINPITTPASGAYAFTNLDPRIQYVVQFQRPAGYVFATANSGSDTTDSDAVPSSSLPLGIGRTGPISLTAGQNNSTVDAGLLLDASIGDRVWYDTDNDGQQDAGEGNVSGVTVRLLNSAGQQARDEQGNLIPDQVTPASGLYLFDNLRPGTYSLWFLPSTLPAGYTFAQRDIGADATDSDPNRFTGLTTTEVLAQDENNRTYDAGVVTEAAIGNFVWEDRNANGQQDGGLEVGIPNVTVRLLNGSSQPIDNPNTDAIGDNYEVMTNGSGLYSFVGLPPNENYIVQWVLPNGYIWTRPNTGADITDSDGTNTDATTGLGVGNVTTTTASFNTLTPGSTDNTWDQGVLRRSGLGDRVWSDNNDDGLQTTGESGINGVTVRLLDSTGSPVDNPNTATVGDAYIVTTSTVAGISGTYAFTNLYPGQYIVQFTTPTSGPRYIRSYYYVGSGTNATTDSNNQETGLNAGRTPVITLPYDFIDPTWDAGFVPLATIGDLAWIDLNNDGIRAGAGEVGLAGVTVTLRDSTGALVLINGAGQAVSPIVTPSTGLYSFPRLDPRLDYIVEFSMPAQGGYKRSPYNVLTGGGTAANNSDASLTDGRTTVIPLTSYQSDPNWDAGFTPLARIGDYVWVDTNGDGQQNEPPANGINGVTVTLLDSSNNPVTLDGLGNPIAPIMTSQ